MPGQLTGSLQHGLHGLRSHFCSRQPFLLTGSHTRANLCVGCQAGQSGINHALLEFKV